jgi:cell division protein FtsQ
MFGKKRVRKNRYKKGVKARRSGKKRFDRGIVAAKLAGVLLVCLMLSLVYVFVYEFFTQTAYFATRKITVAGIQRLSQGEVMRQSGVVAGMNILKVNLQVVRRSLLAHPWVASARVAREIPDTIHIRIVEQRPVAVVDLGKRYLINGQGRIFKEQEPGEPEGLPLITGVSLADISLQKEPSSRAYRAVMAVLNLGRQTEAVLPNGQIKAIHADPQMGISLVAFEGGKKIRLGFGEYKAKYEKLADILTMLEKKNIIRDFDRIDLNDLNRVVVAPSGDESQSQSGKEVKLARTG